MALSECSNCHNPIPDRSAECTYCGSPRGAVSHLRCRIAPNHLSGSARPTTRVSLGGKALWIYIASLAAAVLLSLGHENIFRQSSGGAAGIVGMSVVNFATAVWFTLIPGRAGLFLAVGALVMRTYLQWTGHAAPPLF